MAVEAPRRSRSLKKLAMLARDASWCRRSLLNRLEQLSARTSFEAGEGSRCAHQARWPTAVAQQKDLPVSEVARDPREKILNRCSQCARSRKSRMIAQLTKRREPKAKSYLAIDHWKQHTLYESSD
jgi:hypothetical protein